MDVPSAKELLHDNAVYLHRQDQYMVRRLDLENHTCYVESADVNFYTDSIVKTDIKVLHEDRTGEAAGTGTIIGDVLVRTQTAKYKKLKYQTHENIGYGDIYLPEEEMHTRSIALVFGDETAAGQAFTSVPEVVREQLIGRIGTLLKQVAPVFLLCDTRDLGVAERLRDPHTGAPTIYIYDRAPGGSGLAEGFSEKLEEIRNSARDVVTECPCEAGCPSCIGPEDENFTGTDMKKAVIGFLDLWCGA